MAILHLYVGASNSHAISARNVSGGKIFQNTISDPAHKGGTAIRYFNGTNVTLHGNNFSGTGWQGLLGSTDWKLLCGVNGYKINRPGGDTSSGAILC